MDATVAFETPFVVMPVNNFDVFSATVKGKVVSYDNGIRIIKVPCDTRVQPLGVELYDDASESYRTYYLQNPLVKLPNSCECAYAFAGQPTNPVDDSWVLGTSFFEGRTTAFTTTSGPNYQISIADTKPLLLESGSESH